MWVGAQAAATVTVIGLALVAGGLHDAGGHRRTAASVPTHRPPAAALPETSHARVRPAPARPHRLRPATAVPIGTPTRQAVSTGRRSVHHAGRPRPEQPTARPVSFASALAAAVGRIPTYRSGQARWVVSRAYDFWGTADWYHDVLYVSPDVPRDKLFDVAVHEWSHELSVLDYAADVAAATRAMNAWFGGSDLAGAERAADCMAILQGATWTHYTSCDNAHWRAGAQRLVSGRRL